MKLGLIRCLKTEEICSTKYCLEHIANQEGNLHGLKEEIELTAIATCGGCPGTNVASRVERMKEQGIEGIMLASCIKLGTPVEFPCPYYDEIKAEILAVDKQLTLWTETHPASFKEIFRERFKTNNLLNFFQTGMDI